MWRVTFIIWCSVWASLEGAALAENDAAPSTCVTELSQRMLTRPRASSQEVIRALRSLKSSKDEIVFKEITPEFKSEIQKYFDADPATASRLEHLYALLYLVAVHAKDRFPQIEISAHSMQNLIRSSRVFPSSEFEDSIAGSEMKWIKDTGRAQWKMDFGVPELSLKLNDGLGFKGFEHGVCQHVQKIIVYNSFEFSLEKNQRENILARFNKTLDFEGEFGSKGRIVDVSVKYITLREIEFLHGSKRGVVEAVIARREFEQNSHSWLFQMLAKVVGQKSTQPIDW